MNVHRGNIIVTGCFFLFCFAQAPAQEKVVDRMVATVGNEAILQSQIEMQYQQFLSQGNAADEEIKCQILDQLLLNKLMVYHAAVDSLTVTDEQVDSELDRRMRFFIQQIGSQEKLEAYYKKSILEIKSEFRTLIKEQLLAQTMQSKITKDITATPADVRTYFTSLPSDSIPYINAEMELGQIVKKAPVSSEEKKRIREKLNELRERILKGEDFATLAVLYSQDLLSAKKGGELGFVNRTDLVPAFSATAFNLKGNQVSEIIETEYGFHIIQLIERRGEQINCRHILLKPSIGKEDLANAKKILDSLATEIQSGKISFADAAVRYSDDVDSKNNGGTIVNPQTGTTKFENSQLEPVLFFQVDKLKPGELSAAVPMETADGQQAYRILLLKSRSEPHRANLKDDYQQMQAAALAAKQSKAITDWVLKKKKITYINVNKDFNGCGILKEWLN